MDKIVDWNIVVTEATDTPVFRQLADDMLWKLFEAKAINVEMLLENTSAPFAQKLLAQVRSAPLRRLMNNGFSIFKNTVSVLPCLSPRFSYVLAYCSESEK